MTTAASRRLYAREWARRKRARLLAEQRATAHHCPYRMGPATCGGELRLVRNAARQWIRSCPRCERRVRGICQDCDNPVEGRIRSALRCRPCKRKGLSASTARYVARHRGLVRRKARRYARQHREARCAYKRLWRQAHPEKVRDQKRRYAVRQPQRLYEYQRAYRMAAEIEGRTLPRGPHACLGACGAILCGRPKKCDGCKERDQREALRQLGNAA